MPLGASRIALFSNPQVVAEAEVIRAKVGVSAEGTAQISNTESVFGGASALFDGSGDYLEIQNDEKWDLQQDEWTVEGWFRVTTINNGIKAILTNRTADNGWFIHTLDDDLYFNFMGGGDIQVVDGVSSNTWHHFAAVKESNNTHSIYLDGNLGQTTTTNSVIPSPENLLVGRDPTNLTRDFTGHIDELRISNTARYTTNFTPQTEPFVNDENTLLLLHMDGDGTPASQFFEDDNGVRPKIGVYGEGGATIGTVQSKFGGSAYQSGYTGDRVSGRRLRVKHTDQWQLGINDFTIECWAWVDEDFGSTETHIWAHRTRTDGPGLNLRCEASPNIFDLYDNQNNYAVNIDSQVWNLDEWYHLAAVRENGTLTFYVDGVSQGTASYTYDHNHELSIGNLPYASVLGFPGLIDEFRVSNTARYTANFTPQTEPFVNDENTLLLLHMDGTDGSTDFPDDNGVRSKIGVPTLSSNPAISTQESKFGGASVEFDGVDDYIDCATPVIPATTPFTIELWLYARTINSDKWSLSQYRDGAAGRTAMVFNSGKLNFFINGSPEGEPLLTSSTLNTNQWYHVAVTRESNQDLTIFLDGTQGNVISSAGASVQQIPLRIGGGQGGSGQRHFDGYIDEVRISNTARYSSNFTPPTEPFQNDDNTLLLLHMDGTDGSQTFVDDNGVPPNWDYGA